MGNNFWTWSCKCAWKLLAYFRERERATNFFLSKTTSDRHYHLSAAFSSLWKYISAHVHNTRSIAIQLPSFGPLFLVLVSRKSPKHIPRVCLSWLALLCTSARTLFAFGEHKTKLNPRLLSRRLILRLSYATRVLDCPNLVASMITTREREQLLSAPRWLAGWLDKEAINLYIWTDNYCLLSLVLCRLTLTR